MSSVLPASCDRLLRVRGTVQGVGFRPFVWRHATGMGLKGWVRNDAEGVLVRAVGDPGCIDRLVETLWNEAPEAARIVAVERLEGDVVDLPRPGLVNERHGLPGWCLMRRQASSSPRI